MADRVKRVKIFSTETIPSCYHVGSYKGFVRLNKTSYGSDEPLNVQDQLEDELKTKEWRQKKTTIYADMSTIGGGGSPVRNQNMFMY